MSTANKINKLATKPEPEVDINFNVNDLVMKSMENAVKATVEQVVEFLSQKYDFNFEEAMNAIKLNTVRKLVEKKNNGDKVTKTKEPFSLPFNGVENLQNCRAICCNNGLFTQCPNARKPEKMNLCTPCFNKAMKNSNHEPNYGLIDKRIQVGLYEFKDPKGKSVLPYYKYMEKKKITKNQVVEYALQKGIILYEEHFTYEPPKKTRAKKVIATEDNNLMDAVKKAGSKKTKKVSKTEQQLVDFAKAKVFVKNGKTFEEMVSILNIPEDIAKEAIEVQAKAAQKSANAKAKKEAQKLAEQQLKEQEQEQEQQEQEQEQEQEEQEELEQLELELEEEEEEDEEITMAKLLLIQESVGKESMKPTTFDGTKYLLGKTSNLLFDYNLHKTTKTIKVIGIYQNDEVIIPDENIKGCGYDSDDYEDDIVHDN